MCIEQTDSTLKLSSTKILPESKTVRSTFYVRWNASPTSIFRPTLIHCREFPPWECPLSGAAVSEAPLRLHNPVQNHWNIRVIRMESRTIMATLGKPRWLKMSKLIVVLTLACVAMESATPAQASKWVDDIIFKKCASAMRQEFQKAGQQLLLSRMNETCNCVVKEMNNHQSIEQAKTFCTK